MTLIFQQNPLKMFLSHATPDCPSYNLRQNMLFETKRQNARVRISFQEQKYS